MHIIVNCQLLSTQSKELKNGIEQARSQGWWWWWGGQYIPNLLKGPLLGTKWAKN